MHPKETLGEGQDPDGKPDLGFGQLGSPVPSTPSGQGKHTLILQFFLSSPQPHSTSFHHLGLIIIDHSRDGHVLPIRFFPN